MTTTEQLLEADANYPRAVDVLPIEEGLWLESWKPEDGPLLYQAVHDNEAFLVRTQPFFGDMTREFADHIVRTITANMAAGKLAGYKIMRHGEFVGSVNLAGREGTRVNMGYWLIESATGQGIATKAAAAAANYALNEWGIDTVRVETRPDNKPSVRMMEKIGAELAALQDPENPGDAVYEIRKHDHTD